MSSSEVYAWLQRTVAAMVPHPEDLVFEARQGGRVLYIDIHDPNRRNVGHIHGVGSRAIMALDLLAQRVARRDYPEISRVVIDVIAPPEEARVSS